MTVDPFTAQQRVDAFREALGPYGQHLTRVGQLDELLAQAIGNDWTPGRLGRTIAAGMPRSVSSPGGLVMFRLRELASRPEPVTAASSTPGRRGPFVQPMPPCGRCDGTPARWRDVETPGRKGQAVVEHCPDCWVAPPGYVAPVKAWAT